MNQQADSQAGHRQRNLRLALILASVAAAFFVGFVVKITLLGKA
jgi:hypothetical protein